jgi:hypothetical protein
MNGRAQFLKLNSIKDEPYDLTIKKQKYKFELLDALKKEVC